MTTNLLEKINRKLASPRRTACKEDTGVVRERTVHRKLQDALSGALKERCSVFGQGDDILAVIPAAVLVANGVRVAENAIEGGPSILTGTVRAVANAERRVAKLMGEHVGARLCGYDPAAKTAVFVVLRGTSPTTP